MIQRYKYFFFRFQNFNILSFKISKYQQFNILSSQPPPLQKLMTRLWLGWKDTLVIKSLLPPFNHSWPHYLILQILLIFPPSECFAPPTLFPDAGTCGSISSSSSCGDSATSYYKEITYNGKRVVISNQVNDDDYGGEQLHKKYLEKYQEQPWCHQGWCSLESDQNEQRGKSSFR